MIRLLIELAITHVAGRGRQTAVSVAGVALGVGFSIAMAALMQGSQNDLMDTLVEEYPHVTVTVDTKKPPRQPAEEVFQATSYSGLRPREDRRGILNPVAVEASLRSWIPGNIASTMNIEAVARYGGTDKGLRLIGIVPDEYSDVSTLADKMEAGTLDDLKAVTSGIILGDGAAEDLGVATGSTISVASSLGVKRDFKVVGIFNSGVSAEDNGLGYITLKNAQTLAGQIGGVNSMRLRLQDPYAADGIARRIEATSGLDAESWEEANQSFLEAILVRNTIMYTVVGAILLVAGFGIYNIVSTITHEKARDIAILKSLGFSAGDMRRLFLMEGLAMGIAGSLLGWAIGYGLTQVLASIRFEIKAEVEMTHLPVVVEPLHYAIAAAFAVLSAAVAGYLPARKAASLNPVDIIRGAT
jgi:lipoprotein-releasing system permease protein